MSEHGGGVGGRNRRQPGLFDRGAAPVEEDTPWLEAIDDDDDEGVAIGGLAVTALVAFLLLAVAGGLGWWMLHRAGGGIEPDGSLIEAPTTPYKVRPADPGGKEFEGTGDSSYIVGEGGTPGAALDDDDGPPPVVSPAATQATAATAIPAQPAGVGVQVGAFPSHDQAEAAWAILVRDHDVLAGVPHRVLEGRADLGAVFFLQAVPGGEGEARALCGNLTGVGVKCQVKR